MDNLKDIAARVAQIEKLLNHLEAEIQSYGGITSEVCAPTAAQQLEKIRLEIEELKQKLDLIASRKNFSDPQVSALNLKLDSLLSQQYYLWHKCHTSHV